MTPDWFTEAVKESVKNTKQLYGHLDEKHLAKTIWAIIDQRRTRIIEQKDVAEHLRMLGDGTACEQS